MTARELLLRALMLSGLLLPISALMKNNIKPGQQV
jgi:hypothetical protein